MKTISKKIVFFGNEKLATGINNVQPVIKDALKSAGYQIEQVVTGPIASLKPHQANIAVLAAYGFIIPQKIIDQFPLGIINIHPSLLPLYRGPTPIESAILFGDSKTGVSIMQISSKMDEGPIYRQKSIKIDQNDTKQTLYLKLQKIGADIVVEVLDNIIKEKLKPRSQPHPVRATYTSKITKQDGEIDWQKSAETIEREIRAYAGWPSSRTKFNNISVSITKAHAVPSAQSNKNQGEIEISVKEGIIKVHTSDGILVVDNLKPDGRKDMNAKAFLAGYSSKIS